MALYEELILTSKYVEDVMKMVWGEMKRNVSDVSML